MSEQVTTRDELDALPDRSVVLDSDGDAWAKEGDTWVFGINRWDAALLLGSAPLVVLHVSGRPHALQRVQPSQEDVAHEIRSALIAYNEVTEAVQDVAAEHDQRHGVWHLTDLAIPRVLAEHAWVRESGWVDSSHAIQRSALVKAASLLVAAIELLDREAEGGAR